MAMTASPFILKDVSLTLIKSSDTTGTPTEYRCQLSQAQLTPSQGGGGNTLDTFCDSYEDKGSTTWALDLAGFQAFADVTDFSIVSFNDDGETFDFVLSPLGGTVSATNPAFEGQVTMAATPIGGTAKQYAQFTVSLGCVGKPTMITAP